MHPQLTTKELTPEEIFKVQHEEWLKHPMTIYLMKGLERHKTNILNQGITISADYSHPDNFFRCLSYGAKTVSSLINQIKSSELFLNLSKQQ